MKTTINRAKFIKSPDPFVKEFRTEAPAPMFRRHFTVGKGLVSAKLAFAALGIGKVFIGGRNVTTDLFVSPVSDYRKTVWYTVYDVTALLSEGENVAAVMLGNGFYNESLHTSWDFDKADWRDSVKLWFELELTYDERVEYIRSDESWLTDTASSPVRFNELRLGECYDDNFASDWMDPDFDDSGWRHAVIADPPEGKLTLCPSEPIREFEVYNCVRLFRNPRGAYVFDFGQNISGYVHVKAKLPAGTKLHITYAEEIEENGERRDNSISNFYRDGETQFCEVTAGEKALDWKPYFSYSGFRYAIVSGFPGEPCPDCISAVFVHQAVRETGHFACSDRTVDKIWKFARMSTLSNMFYSLTDCPTREKLGWCNDAQASCEQTVQNYDMRGFYKKWLHDIFDSMKPDGDLPGIVPTYGWGYAWGSGPVSTGILFEIPSRVLQYYGDDSLLIEAYPYMKKHLGFLESKAVDGLISHGLPDWALPRDAKDRMPVPLEFTCTLLMIKFLRIAAMAAERLGEDSSVHAEREKFYTESFMRHYIGSDGRLVMTEQTASAMTIALGIGDLEVLKPQFYDTFVKYDWHFHVGMLGMQYMLPACDICGFEDEGVRLLTAKGHPSYGEWFDDYDATTLHEMWVDDASKNHHMFSCPVAWLHNSILGIRRDESYFTEKRFVLEPHFPKGLDSAEGEYDTLLGKIKVAWRRDNGKVRLSVVIPDGVTAEFKAPGIEKELTGGCWEFTLDI